MQPTYIRVTYVTERIDDNTGTVKEHIVRVVTGKVTQRRGDLVTVQKDNGGSLVINEQSPAMGITMRVEYFDDPPER